MRKTCSLKKIVKRRAHALISLGWPPGPRPSLLKRYTRAEVVREPSQVRKERESSQGPIVSARHGVGRCISTQILMASVRSSSQSLMMNEHAVRGQTTLNRDK